MWEGHTETKAGQRGGVRWPERGLGVKGGGCGGQSRREARKILIHGPFYN